MRHLVILFLIPSSFVSALWPIPSSYSHGETELWISSDIKIRYDIASDINDEGIIDQDSYESPTYTANESNIPLTGKALLTAAIQRTKSQIFKHSYIPWKFHPRTWTSPSPTSSSTYITTLTLSQPDPNPYNFVFAPAGAVDESYSLDVTEDGEARISATTTIGLLRGLTTFTQLFYADENSGDAYTSLAPIQITDTPKFAHRGLNLDVARAWIPVSAIKRTIDALAYNKMNRLHLHATDSQSWPLEIPSLPTLAEKGAYRPQLTYSAADFRDIQRYAALQGVQVITEIDMPGHTASIWHSFPELIAAYNVQPEWNTYAAEPPSGTLKLNSSAVDQFLETLFDDLLPRIVPFSAYFHTGGDEVNKMAYTLDDTVRSSDFAVLQPLMQKFIDRNHGQVRKAGLTPMVWEEMLLDWELELGDDVVVQTWQSNEAVAQVVGKGYKTLVGNYKYWYLDCGKGQWLDFPNTATSSSNWPYNDYCFPFHNWRLIYSYDPLSNIPSSLHHLVLGGEAHIWGEQTDPVNLDRMVWPRACAVAEVLWSGAKDEMGRNRSQVEASPRLSDMRERLVAMGVGAEPVQMPYCTMNGTECALGV